MFKLFYKKFSNELFISLKVSLFKKMQPKLFIFLLILIATSCSSNKYAATNRDYKRHAKNLSRQIKQIPTNNFTPSASPWIGTTNFGLRNPNFVVIHHTAQNSCNQTFTTFTLPRTQVSAHYVICKDGRIQHMLNDNLRAWHAGIGSWGNDKDINSCSIGIELDNNGYDSFPAVQINSLISVLDTLKRKYRIPAANFIGHSDIAPARKRDPNVNFPWQYLSTQGYGLWYGDTSIITVPQNFNNLQALRIIGYSVKDSGAAIIAFKRHFETQDSSDVLDANDQKILYDLMLRYQ